MNRKKLLQGVMLLTLSSLLLRGIGMAYRVVLSERIGTEGMGLYQLIMTVYGLFSMLSCAGLTITVSRLCAEHPQASGSIVRKASLYAVLLGTLLGFILYIGADFISSRLLTDERAVLALRWIAPSLPMMGISAALRGYFLAKGDVWRPTIAQITEQLVRVTLVLSLLYGFDVTGLTSSCAVILFGATAAEMVSVIMHIVFYLHSREHTPEKIPLNGILRGVGPILTGSMMQNGLQTAENLLIPTLLKASGTSASHALSQYGLLGGMVLPIILFPAAFPAAVGTLLIPEIARENALGRQARVQHLTCRTLSSTLWMSAAFCALFLVFGNGLMLLLYDSEAAGGLLILLAPLMPILYLDNLCDTLLKGLGKQTATMIIETLDSALRIVCILLLLPRMGMLGYIIVLYGSAVLCSAERMKLLMRSTGLARSTLLKLLAEPLLLFCKRKTHAAH